MTAIKNWFRMLSFGNTKRYCNLLLWFFLDSVVATIPYGIVVMVIYYLLVPLSDSNQLIPTQKLWVLFGVLIAQFLAYFFIR